jgi:hypothetical protein
MLGPDHGWWSAARVEIDHRAREARLQLEHLERLVISRVLPTRSRSKRVLDRRGLRFFCGGCVQTRSARMAQSGSRHRRTSLIPTEVFIAARGAPVAVKAAIGCIVHGPGTA